MDKGLLYFLALLAGLLAGLLAWRRWRPLLAERWRFLYLAIPAMLVSAFPFLAFQIRPALIWSGDRSLLLSLVLLRALVWSLLLLVNLLPARFQAGMGKPGLTRGQKLCLLPAMAGLAGETAVLLLNRGYWPVSEAILAEAANPALAAGIRNNAYVFLRVIDSGTRLPWLGQIWHAPWLSARGLSVLPAISPAEATTAAGLFIIGLSQFLAPDLPGRLRGRSRKAWRLRRPGIRKAALPEPRSLSAAADCATIQAHPPVDRKNTAESRRRSGQMGKKKIFSRPDGTYLKNIDPFMRFFPYIMKGRNESAIYFHEQIDVTRLKAWLLERNRAAAASGDGIKSTLFHAVLAALVRTVHERPQINRFIIGRRIYQRHDLSCAFVIKREFKDDSNEEIAVMKFKPDDTMTSISQRIRDEVQQVREKARENEQKRNGIVNWFNYLMNMPRILLRGLVRFLAWLDYHGWLPRFFVELDPMHSSIFISNLGSLGIDAPFHHLYEWGTTSIFMTIGVAKKTPVANSNGDMEVRDVVNLAFTIDERISDGYYFARSMKRLRFFLERPEELDKPAILPGQSANA